MVKHETRKHPHDGDAAYTAFRILQIAFVIVPIFAGIDKFINLLVNWNHYLNPMIPQWVRVDRQLILMIVGIVEIIAGIGAAWKPQFFGYIIALWLLLIISNLFILGNHFDIILRDFGLMLAAFSLGLLGTKYSK